MVIHMAAANNTAARVLELARGYLNTTDGSKFCRYYNQIAGTNIPLNSPWCACFVTYIMRMAGVPTTEIPNFCGCTTGTNQMKRLGTFKARESYTPKPGDVILFDWNPAGNDGVDHTGIVESVSNGRVMTIEGNAGNNGVCLKRDYPLTSSIIVGYGIPSFKTTQKETPIKEEEDLNAAETRKIAQEEAAKVKPAMYKYYEDVPVWAQPAIKYFTDSGIIEGVGKNKEGKAVLNVSEDMVRICVMLHKILMKSQ